jgi:hypothetical protein
MKLRNVLVGFVGALLLAGALGSATGCFGTVFKNLTKERTGNITVQFINNTAYRASFSYGTWDAWDNTPGQITLQQLRLEAGTSSTPGTVPCRRNAAVATQALYTRAVLTKADQATSFDADAFDTVVHFSAAPKDSTAAALPTQGTAAGIEKLLGIDYSCADTLIFTFNEDPAEPGGFRIDFVDILDTRAGQ